MRALQIIKNQKYICIAGTADIKTPLPDGRIDHNWSFIRMKTKSGYLDYFTPDWRVHNSDKPNLDYGRIDHRSYLGARSYRRKALGLGNL